MIIKQINKKCKEKKLQIISASFYRVWSLFSPFFFILSRLINNHNVSIWVGIWLGINYSSRKSDEHGVVSSKSSCNIIMDMWHREIRNRSSICIQSWLFCVDSYYHGWQWDQIWLMECIYPSSFFVCYHINIICM